MANVKMLRISDEVLLEAVHEHLRSDSAMYASLANSIIALVRKGVQLPPDARICGHAVNGDGTVSLQLLSQTFPYVPDGMPFNQIAEFSGIPVVTERKPAETPSSGIPEA